MREIQLTQGQTALVDDCDFEYLAQWSWYCCHGYAMRKGPRPQRRAFLMHRVVADRMGLDIVEREVDHRDNEGSKCDNRRSNLRVATPSQQRQNCGRRSNNISGFKGVRRSGTRWRAQITLDGKQHHLGTFDTPPLAAAAYNARAVELFGEFAYPNDLEHLAEWRNGRRKGLRIPRA